MEQNEINEIEQLLYVIPAVLLSLFLIVGYTLWAIGTPGKTRTLKELFEKIFKWRST